VNKLKTVHLKYNQAHKDVSQFAIKERSDNTGNASG
jgi:hypothetical protein